jgi:hypothetical protein
MTRMHNGTWAWTAVALTPLLALAACGKDGSNPDGSGAAAGSQGIAGVGGVPTTSAGATATAGSGGAAGAASGNGATSNGAAAASSAGNGSANASGGDAGGAPVSGICPYTAPQDPDPIPAGFTRSPVTVFNDNGAWTWYNDERVVIDAAAGKLVVSSSESSASSQTTNPNIDVVIYDLATKQSTKQTLGQLSYSDDHNNGGIVVTAPGEYFAAYAHHNKECNSYWAKYAGGAWGTTVTHPWADQGCPWVTDSSTSYVTYNNLWKLSSENRIYNLVRSVETSPTFLYSEDDGATWKFGGRLTGSKQVGYNAGYYKFWGNGVDRIDFFATESHPRDSDTSLYHGYVKDKKVYDSGGTEIDADLFDSDAHTIQEFTPVFNAGTELGGVKLHRLWNFDIARYTDGSIGVLWQGRENSCSDKNDCTPGHHLAYSRFDGNEWKSTRLVKGGRTLYRDRTDWWEEDYLGGGALDPDDPHIIYISTNIDPRDDKTEYPVNEIWKGVTCDSGATFVWSPITMNSVHENLRPVVPKWDAQNSALLWFRGDYETAQMYSAEVVGIIERR